MQEYNWAQEKIDDLFGDVSAQRHEEQRKFYGAIRYVLASASDREYKP